MSAKIKSFILLSLLVFSSTHLFQGCMASTLKGMREGPIDDAIENGQLNVGMSWSEVTSLIGTPTIWCDVKNQSSSSGTKKVWITDARAQVWLNRYELVFVNGKLESWSQR